jgi:hypothetical protein
MDQDLVDLLSAWLGAELEAARRDQLIARLRRDDAFQRSFVDEIAMLGMIKVVQATEPRWLRLQDELGWPAARGTGEHEHDWDDRLMKRVRSIAIRPSLGGRTWRVVAGVAAVALLIVGLAALGVFTPAQSPRVPAPVVAASALAPAPVIKPASGLALVVKLEAVLWEPGDSLVPAEGSILKPGDRLRLHAGRAALSFFSGVTLILEGPADLELMAMDRVFCHRGRLRARVPAGAEGFVVASPGSAVIDLGTEFAVNVAADGTSWVMVFDGMAEAALLDASGAPMKTQLVEQSEAFALDPRTGRIAAAEPRPDEFVIVTPTDRALPTLPLDPDYPAAVLASRPRGYWRFESLADGAVPNEVAGGQPLRVHGPIGVPQAGGPSENGCAVFPADEPAQFLATDGLWELPRTPGHALEFWFLADEFHYASLVGLFPPKDYLKRGSHGRHIHTFLLELTARDRQSLFKPASLRFLHRWPLDTRIGNNLFSEDIYVPRRWHHVVAQKNGPTMELFVDGRSVGTQPVAPDHPTVTCRLVVGRRNPDPLETHDSRSFVGRLDELALYDHPLPPEDVQNHYQLAASKEGHK